MRALLTRLGLNSLWLLLARIGAQGLMVLFTILLARRLGSAGFGAYAFIAATLVIGNLLTTFGTDMVLMREIAAQGDLSGLPAALVIQLALSIGFVFMVFAWAGFLPNQAPTTVLALRVYCLALFPLAFYTVFSSALRGKERMYAYAALSLAGNLLQVISVWLAPINSLINLALMLLLVQLLVSLLGGMLCTLQIPGFWNAWHFSPTTILTLLRSSAPIGFLAVLGAVYQKLSLGLLSVMAGPALTGWFAAALRAVEASKTVHTAAFMSIFPVMARREDGSSGLLRYSWYLLLGGAAACALPLCVFAGPLVNLLFGMDFAPVVPVLRILAWMLVPYTANTFLSLALMAAKQERSLALALSTSLAALIIFSLWWIPLLGLSGAAWAALTAESLQSILLLSQRGAVARSGLLFGFSKEGMPHGEFSKLS